MIKFKISNFKELSSHQHFIFGIYPNNKINECHHYKTGGIILNKGASYNKGQLKLIGTSLSSFNVENSVLYLYANISKNLFAVFDENKQMIYLKSDNSIDFEANNNDWNIFIGGSITQMLITILGSLKEEK